MAYSVFCCLFMRGDKLSINGGTRQTKSDEISVTEPVLGAYPFRKKNLNTVQSSMVFDSTAT